MADKKDPLSAHNPQFEADIFQNNGENEINVRQATELEINSVASNQEDAEVTADSLSPMRKEWIPIDSTFPETTENARKLKECNTVAVETKAVNLPEFTLAVLEVSRDQLQVSEVTNTTDLADSEPECEEKDEREKIMPKEIHLKVLSIIPALLKVVDSEDDKC